MIQITNIDEMRVRLSSLRLRADKVRSFLRGGNHPKHAKALQVMRLITESATPIHCAINRLSPKAQKTVDTKRLIGMEVVSELPMSLLYTKYKDHRRLKVFAEKGLKCSHPECNLVGERLIALKDMQGGIHIDVFTKDYRHMNVDHIIPKSKGGGEELSNKQPTCARHNGKKANKIVSW